MTRMGTWNHANFRRTLNIKLTGLLFKNNYIIPNTLIYSYLYILIIFRLETILMN
jgi:hypothetical protein